MEKSSSFVIRRANGEDIPSMVSLSDQKRRFYEKANPHFGNVQKMLMNYNVNGLSPY